MADDASVPSDPLEGDYDNIRQILGSLIGCRLVDITQTDRDELTPQTNLVSFHFDNGASIHVNVQAGGGEEDSPLFYETPE